MPGCFLIALVLFFLAAIARWRTAPEAWYWGTLTSAGLFFLTLALGWTTIKALF